MVKISDARLAEIYRATAENWQVRAERAEQALAAARADALREAAEKLRYRYNTVKGDKLLWAHEEILALIDHPAPAPTGEAETNNGET